VSASGSPGSSAIESHPPGRSAPATAARQAFGSDTSPLRLLKHFELDVDEREAPLRNGSRHRDAEETRSRPEFQNAIGAGEVKVTHQLTG
jgi:hypothetical protein